MINHENIHKLFNISITTINKPEKSCFPLCTLTYIKQVWIAAPIKLRAFKVSFAAVVAFISTAFNYAKSSIGIMNQIHRNVHEQKRQYENYSLVILEIHKTFQHIFASPSTKQISRLRFPFSLFSLLHSFFFHCKSSDFCAPTTTPGDLHNFLPVWFFRFFDRIKSSTLLSFST